MARGLITDADAKGLQRIGPRLRAARLSRRLSIRAVSELTGLTGSTLSRAERNERSLSVTNLTALCDVLGITIGALFDDPATFSVKAGEGVRIAAGRTVRESRLISPRGEDQFRAMRATIKPSHHPCNDVVDASGQLGLLHVLSGTANVDVDKEVHQLNTGDSLTFNGDVLTALWAPGPDVAIVLLLLIPSR